MSHLKRRAKFIFLMSAGALGIVFLVLGVYQLEEFTDSTAFCGRLCHTVMYPQYTVYQDSPHSRVTCSKCHVGSGVDYLVRSKISGIPMIFSTITGNFERPIPTPVKNLRPARETCEQCHRPERFAGDILRVHTTYLPDEANTQKVLTWGYRVGGGEFEVARDIHWHIAATVNYLAVDEKRQEIVWVSSEDGRSGITQYADLKRDIEISHEDIENEKRLMDCMDCHNRATHIFRSPEEHIDIAITKGKIDDNIPFIKREGLQALDPPDDSLEKVISKVEAIKEFYQTSYPDVYSGQGREIDQSIEELKKIASLTTFPDMKIDWDTYIDNSGHQKSPGCFRCHGKLTAVDGEKKGEVISAECELCHYTLVAK
ncbi:NapC/NirT family cytochrome c [Chloroflexota bacterium]